MKAPPRNIARIFFALWLALLTALTATATETNAAAPEFTVKLYYRKEIALKPPEVQTLYSNAVKLLRSSSFNSSKTARAPMQWDVAKVADDYRFTVSGSYLLISFNQNQNIHSGGGELVAREIIIALNERYGKRSELFTIDDEGRVIGHGKYSGEIIVELLRIAKKVANNA